MTDRETDVTCEGYKPWDLLTDEEKAQYPPLDEEEVETSDDE